MLTIDGIEGLRARLGQDLGVSDWVEVSQADIDAFAKATRDFYWIHVDPSRARELEFGSTIAHGLLTLSLGPGLSNEFAQTFERDGGDKPVCVAQNVWCLVPPT